MAQSEQEILEYLKFELKFLEDGGYGRSPHTPWRPQYIFEDSPSCLNFDDATKPHPCEECQLVQFVPDEERTKNSPCRFIPLNERGETVDHFYRSGTQVELEEALGRWLRKQISRMEERIAGKAAPQGTGKRNDVSKPVET